MGLCLLLGWFCPLWGLRRLVRVAGPLTQGRLSAGSRDYCHALLGVSSLLFAIQEMTTVVDKIAWGSPGLKWLCHLIKYS